MRQQWFTVVGSIVTLAFGGTLPAYAERGWTIFEDGQRQDLAYLLSKGFEARAALKGGEFDFLFMQKGADLYRCNVSAPAHLQGIEGIYSCAKVGKPRPVDLAR